MRLSLIHILRPEQEAFARSIIALACRNLSDAQMAYLKNVNGYQFTAEFIRMYGAKLAVTAMQSFSKKNQKSSGNPCAFIFWIDKLLEVAPEQVLNDSALWLNYLNWCVTYQHFDALCKALNRCANYAVAFDALAYVFAIHEQPMIAKKALHYLNCQAQNYHTPGELMVHLIDDELSYCVRFADRVERLVSEGRIGNPNAAYIYDYVRIRRYAHVVNGCMINYFVNEADVEGSLIEEMTYQLKEYLDYESTLVSVRLIENVATSVEKW